MATPVCCQTPKVFSLVSHFITSFLFLPPLLSPHPYTPGDSNWWLAEGGGGRPSGVCPSHRETGNRKEEAVGHYTTEQAPRELGSRSEQIKEKESDSFPVVTASWWFVDGWVSVACFCVGSCASGRNCYKKRKQRQGTCRASWREKLCKTGRKDLRWGLLKQSEPTKAFWWVIGKKRMLWELIYAICNLLWSPFP